MAHDSVHRIFHLFDSAQHQAWKRDRQIRHRVRPEQGTRNCVGLAVLYDGKPEEYLSHGLRTIAHNDQVRWLALRDVPPGHFPASPAMNRRPVSWASVCRASLVHGMPHLDFFHPLVPSWDFRSFPVPPFVLDVNTHVKELVERGPDTLDSERFLREFVVLNALSAAITDAAFFGVGPGGKPLHPAWFRQRPKGHGRPHRVRALHRACPVPLLAFRVEQVEQLFWAGTQAPADRYAIRCAACRSRVPLASFAPHGRGGTEVIEDGGLAATCPCCREPRRWFLEDSAPCRSRRRMGMACQEGFADALAKGLVLRATEPATYMGTATQPAEVPPARGLDLVPHRFRSSIDRRHWVVYLPAGAKVMVRAGTKLAPDDEWARALAELPDQVWRAKRREFRAADLAMACGGSAAMSDYLRQLWFSQQGIRLPEDPGHVLFPADLVAPACRDVRPEGLYWNLSPCVKGFVPEAEAFVLPVLWQRRWDELDLVLPGDVRVDAGIGDPRFWRGNPETHREACAHVGRSFPTIPLSFGRPGRRSLFAFRPTVGGTSC